MSDDPDAEVYTADPYDPAALAREAVEAMRATGPVSPELERTLLGGARRHAEFVERHGLIAPDAAPEAF